VPLPGVAAVSRLNALLYRRAIRSSLRRLRLADRPLLWVYAPTVARYLDRLPRRGLVYHCVDRWWAFNDLDQREMRACHEILCRSADVVFASAKTLADDCEPLARRTVLVPHGVEWAHFARAAFEELPRPADLPADGRPILGFFGLIQDWVDQGLIRAVAEQFPQCHVVVLGRSMVDLSPLTGLANLHLLGQKPYQELPAYCRAFAAGLIPFVQNELTEAVNPIKLREYLSAGLPVVSTAMPEVVALGSVDGLHVARDQHQFLDAVAAILARSESAEQRRARAAGFASEGWLGRCLLMARETRHALAEA
jgi:glycosyltransferase involved in cell wall biosynthesis